MLTRSTFNAHFDLFCRYHQLRSEAKAALALCQMGDRDNPVYQFTKLLRKKFKAFVQDVAQLSSLDSSPLLSAMTADESTDAEDYLQSVLVVLDGLYALSEEFTRVIYLTDSLSDASTLQQINSNLSRCTAEIQAGDNTAPNFLQNLENDLCSFKRTVIAHPVTIVDLDLTWPDLQEFTQRTTALWGVALSKNAIFLETLPQNPFAFFALQAVLIQKQGSLHFLRFAWQEKHQRQFQHMPGYLLDYFNYFLLENEKELAKLSDLFVRCQDYAPSVVGVNADEQLNQIGCLYRYLCWSPIFCQITQLNSDVFSQSQSSSRQIFESFDKIYQDIIQKSNSVSWMEGDDPFIDFYTQLVHERPVNFIKTLGKGGWGLKLCRLVFELPITEDFVERCMTYLQFIERSRETLTFPQSFRNLLISLKQDDRTTLSPIIRDLITCYGSVPQLEKVDTYLSHLDHVLTRSASDNPSVDDLVAGLEVCKQRVDGVTCIDWLLRWLQAFDLNALLEITVENSERSLVTTTAEGIRWVFDKSSGILPLIRANQTDEFNYYKNEIGQWREAVRVSDQVPDLNTAIYPLINYLHSRALEQAAATGDSRRVQSLLSARVSMEARDFALNIAVIPGHEAVVSLLLKEDKSIAIEKESWVVLKRAVYCNQLPMMDRLIQEIESRDQRTILRSDWIGFLLKPDWVVFVLKQGYRDIVKCLIPRIFLGETSKRAVLDNAIWQNCSYKALKSLWSWLKIVPGDKEKLLYALKIDWLLLRQGSVEAFSALYAEEMKAGPYNFFMVAMDVAVFYQETDLLVPLIGILTKPQDRFNCLVKAVREEQADLIRLLLPYVDDPCEYSNSVLEDALRLQTVPLPGVVEALLSDGRIDPRGSVRGESIVKYAIRKNSPTLLALLKDVRVQNEIIAWYGEDKLEALESQSRKSLKDCVREDVFQDDKYELFFSYWCKFVIFSCDQDGQRPLPWDILYYIGFLFLQSVLYAETSLLKVRHRPVGLNLGTSFFRQLQQLTLPNDLPGFFRPEPTGPKFMLFKYGDSIVFCFKTRDAARNFVADYQAIIWNRKDPCHPVDETLVAGQVAVILPIANYECLRQGVPLLRLCPFQSIRQHANYAIESFGHGSEHCQTYLPIALLPKSKQCYLQLERYLWQLIDDDRQSRHPWRLQQKQTVMRLLCFLDGVTDAFFSPEDFERMGIGTKNNLRCQVTNHQLYDVISLDPDLVATLTVMRKQTSNAEALASWEEAAKAFC